MKVNKKTVKNTNRKSGPGLYFRKGLSLVEVVRMFPDDDTAEKWFIGIRWADGIECPSCGSDNIQEKTTHPEMHHRCRSCRKFFSVRTGTIMQGSNLGYQTWALAIYLLTTSLKGVSSMKLHRDLNITQKSAWHLAHRIRESYSQNDGSKFNGAVEVDETYMGGLEKNKHESKKLHQGRGATGKTAVLGIKNRDTNEVKAKVIENTKRKTLHDFINRNVEQGSTVCTDDFKSYRQMLRYKHSIVKHSTGEYVNEQAHINGMESFWSMLKRSYKGTYHKMSVKHLHRYVNEFAGRHNIRDKDTVLQMTATACGMVGKQLKYEDLITP